MTLRDGTRFHDRRLLRFIAPAALLVIGYEGLPGAPDASAGAAAISRARHFRCAAVPVTVRFSDGAPKDGLRQTGRYEIVPVAGSQHLDDAAAKAKPPDFVAEDLKDRLVKGPVQFRPIVQIADPGGLHQRFHGGVA